MKGYGTPPGVGILFVICRCRSIFSCLLDLHLVIVRPFIPRRTGFSWGLRGRRRVTRTGLDVIGLLDFLERRVGHQILGGSVVTIVVFHGD